jgi:hypothetical protein
MKLRQPFTHCETVPTPQDLILVDEAQFSLKHASFVKRVFCQIKQ